MCTKALSLISSATGIADGSASLLTFGPSGAGTERGQSTAGGWCLWVKAELDAGTMATGRLGSK
jgi:hypothetical protein